MVLNEFIAFAQLGPLKAAAGSAVVHHRLVRPGGVRQLQLGGYPARRHRRPGARAEAGPRPARHSGDARGHSRQLSLGDDRGDSAVKAGKQGSGEAGRWRGRAANREQRAVEASVEAIRRRLGKRRPKIAVVLGSGLGFLTEHDRGPGHDSLRRDPGFPATTVIGHGARAGGRHGLAGKEVLAQSGRFHLYEGHEPPAVTALPVRVFADAGRSTPCS